MVNNFNSLSNLVEIKKKIKRKRISSYDKSGANADAVLVKPYKKHEICCIEGAGAIKHIWMTLASWNILCWNYNQ